MNSFRNLALVGTTCSLTLLASGQPSPVGQFERGLRPHIKQPSIGAAADILVVKVFEINQVRYSAGISQTALALAPDWKPARPLPIDLAKVEGVARKELRRFVPDDSKWEVTDFHLQAFHGPLAKCWYFQIGLKPMHDYSLNLEPREPGTFWVCVDLAGEPGITQEFKTR